MPKILYIPNEIFISYYYKGNINLTYNEVDIIFDIVKQRKHIDPTWASSYDIILPLLECELEYIPD